MTRALVGYTGFVGSNILKNGSFDSVYNSINIEEAFDTRPDILIYAGLRAEKYLANSAPDKDMELIRQAEYNIAKIAPEKLILISTIDVFKYPKYVNEMSEIEINGLHPYGYNRYMLERWVRERYPDALIIRLPGLFGINLKKNFIYDYINIIPFMLKDEKFIELSAVEPEINKYYIRQNNGFFKVQVKENEKPELIGIFKSLKFSALDFTDSRSRYQFYNLERLYGDINILLDNEITLFHPATEPVSAGELYKYLEGSDWANELSGKPSEYDYRTIHSDLFGGKNGYICSKEEVLRDISKFVEQSR